MAWYYSQGGKQAGPVEDSHLDELVQNGQIQPDTLVWREGMANWQPYRQTRPAAAISGGTVTVAEAPPIATTTSQAVCAECGGVFNLEDTIAYGTARVCARCKPVFIQKLAEGATLNTGGMVYAGFWTRFAASFVDGLILGGFNILTNALTIPAIRGNSNKALGVQLAVMFINIAAGVSYETLMIGRFGATVGKMAMKVKVVTGEGEKVSYLRALGRYFSKIVSGMILMVGYLMAAFDDQKRALHDRMCNTRVIVNK